MPDNSPTFVIRSAQPSDATAIEQLLATFELPTTDIQELFAGDDAQFVLAHNTDSPNELIGVAGLERREDYALLRSVAVRDDWQKRGVADALITQLFTDAAERRTRAVYLLTTTAANYFPRFGFSPITRNAVPAAIAVTHEFTTACPASAVVMSRWITTA